MTGDPELASSMMRFMSRTDGRSRSWKNTPSLTSPRRQRDERVGARGRHVERLFDEDVQPGRAAAMPCSPCSPDGLPIATMSIGRCARNCSRSS